MSLLTFTLFMVALMLGVNSVPLAHRNLKALRTMHTDFMTKYGRTYKSAAESDFRFKTFLSNLKYIDELNERDTSATYGVTKFADWTQQEISKMWVKHSGETEKLLNKMEYVQVQQKEAPPTAFDWRDKNAVTHVKTQGDNCASCWAMSSVAAVETKYAVKHSNLVPFSEQHIINCVYDHCAGAPVIRSFQYMQAVGTLPETACPYTERNDTCGSCPNVEPIVHVTKIDRIQKTADAMVAYLYNKGPITAELDNGNSIVFYTGGIWNPTDCKPGGGHAMVIIGYGEEAGVKFWTIKNSFGPDWGEAGYIRMIRGVDLCYVEHNPLSAEVA